MTIYEKLKEKLGREPTHVELSNECKRIIREAYDTMAEKGKLSYQRKR
jgi:hypothetical protein